MELILGLFPLPITVGILAVVTIGTLIIRKYAKNAKVVDVANAAANSVVTTERVDRAVEAILAKLRVDPVLADKIGDLIAEIVGELLDARKKNWVKTEKISAAVDITGHVNPSIPLRLMARPTALSALLDETAPELAHNQGERLAVATGIVRAYADSRVT